MNEPKLHDNNPKERKRTNSQFKVLWIKILTLNTKVRKKLSYKIDDTDEEFLDDLIVRRKVDIPFADGECQGVESRKIKPRSRVRAR